MPEGTSAPLADVLVVALEQAVAAPLCTARLAEAGARVIKIERAEGDFARGYDHVVHGESAYFVWLNRGKESLVLDIKQADDAALLHRLIARADVFVQNLAPGATTRAGFGSPALRERHPRLITVDISGYGEDGPAAAMKAYDFLIQCETGLASITGGAAEAGRVGVSVADIACGMNAHAAVLQALYVRQGSGQGAAIAVSLFDSIADWMTVPLLHHDYGGRAPGRAGLHHATIAPYGAYRCGDGRHVVIAIQNEREWRRFCAVALGSESVADDPRFADNIARCANRAALDATIEAAFGTIDAGAVIGRLTQAGTAYASLNAVADLSSHPQLRRIKASTPSGPVVLPASPVRWARDDLRLPVIPSVGADSAAIRTEFAPPA